MTGSIFDKVDKNKTVRWLESTDMTYIFYEVVPSPMSMKNVQLRYNKELKYI